MTAALMYCNNEFQKTLELTRKRKIIHEAFEAFALEIKNLDEMERIHLYSIATQLLEKQLKGEGDLVNALEVFVLRCDSIIDKNGVATQLGLVLGMLVLSIAVFALCAASGIGLGILLGLWETVELFMASLMVTETAALIVASVSSVAGLGTGFLSGFCFFGEPGITKAVSGCVEAVKQNHLFEDTKDTQNDKETNMNSINF